MRKRSHAWVFMGLLMSALMLTSCTGFGGKEPDMTREEALAEMLRHADAVTAMLEGELVDDYPPERRMFSCLGDGEQWTLNRKGTVGGSAEEDIEQMSAYLAEQGFTVRFREDKYSMEAIAAITDGVRVQVLRGFNGYTRVTAQSPCFPEQR